MTHEEHLIQHIKDTQQIMDLQDTLVATLEQSIAEKIKIMDLLVENTKLKQDVIGLNNQISFLRSELSVARNQR